MRKNGCCFFIDMLYHADRNNCFRVAVDECVIKCVTCVNFDVFGKGYLIQQQVLCVGSKLAGRANKKHLKL